MIQAHYIYCGYFHATANLTGGMGPWPGRWDPDLKYTARCVQIGIKILHHLRYMH